MARQIAEFAGRPRFASAPQKDRDAPQADAQLDRLRLRGPNGANSRSRRFVTRGADISDWQLPPVAMLNHRSPDLRIPRRVSTSADWYYIKPQIGNGPFAKGRGILRASLARFEWARIPLPDVCNIALRAILEFAVTFPVQESTLQSVILIRVL